MNRLKLLLVFLAFTIALNAFSERPVLRFKNQKFKIVQFTDLHWINDAIHKVVNDSTLLLMRSVIETEKSDFVILTGDIVVSGGASDAWEKLTRPMSELHVPFAVAFGNHDTETDITKQKALELLQKNPYHLTYSADKSLSGVGNCSLPLKSSEGDIDKWVLYLFDSHAYSQDTMMVKGYDWVKNDQIQWYRKQSAAYTKANGKALSSLAFFHIPTPEFEYVRNQETTVGNRSEMVGSPSLNSGLFSAFVEMKDVLGVFVGHDHNDDFVGTVANICLGFGRKTGYAPAYKEILDRGARVFELYENDKKFDTYIRTLSGKYFEYTFKRQ